MGGRFSRLFAHKGAADADIDPSVTPAELYVDSLDEIAAEHWLTLEQLYNLYIKAARTSFNFPCCTPRPPTTASFNAGTCPTGSPSLSPCSPPSHPPSMCEPGKHCAECCSRFSSKVSPSALLTVSASPHQPFRLLTFEPNVPPASPADVIAESASFGSSSFRPSIERDNLYCSRVRPTIEALLLDATPLDQDDLSIVLEYLIDPPQLTPPQIVALTLVTPQLLTDAKANTQQPQPSPAYSDILLSSSGCFTHRKGVIDRSMSMRAKQLRMSFATIRTGLYRVCTDGQLRLSVYGTSEFYFDQHLHDEKRKRVVSLQCEPFDEQRLAECRQRNELCMANQLLLVSGQLV